MLLFIPGQSEPAPEMLDDVGLPGFIRGARGSFLEDGPDQLGPGVLFTWSRAGGDLAARTWLPAVAFAGLALGRYWLGFRATTSPAELLQPYPQPGPSLVLADGHSWTFPRLRPIAPEQIAADDGSWRFEGQRAMHRCHSEAEIWRERIARGDPDDTYRVDDVVEFVLLALSLNYRLTREALSYLGLLNTRLLRMAWQTILEI